jgi:hypothetical protein
MQASVIQVIHSKIMKGMGAYYKQHVPNKANATIEGLNPALGVDIYFGTNHLIHYQSLNLKIV